MGAGEGQGAPERIYDGNQVYVLHSYWGWLQMGAWGWQPANPPARVALAAADRPAPGRGGSC